MFARALPGPDPRAASYMALLEACLTVLRGRTELPEDVEPVYGPAVADLFRISDALIRIRALATGMTEARPLGDFLPVVPEDKRGQPIIVRSAVASTFVAALELCRGSEIGLEQEKPFGTVTVLPLGAIAAEADARGGA